jgi:hypothetical protein
MPVLLLFFSRQNDFGVSKVVLLTTFHCSQKAQDLQRNFPFAIPPLFYDLYDYDHYKIKKLQTLNLLFLAINQTTK